MTYKYRHYIFDFDGTLADTSEGVYDAYQYTFEQLGMPIIDQNILEMIIADPPLDNFVKHFGLSDEAAHEAISVYTERYAQVGIQKAKIVE